MSRSGAASGVPLAASATRQASLRSVPEFVYLAATALPPEAVASAGPVDFNLPPSNPLRQCGARAGGLTNQLDLL